MAKEPSVIVSVYLPYVDFVWYDQQATLKGVSRTAMVRQVLEDYRKRHLPKTPPAGSSKD